MESCFVLVDQEGILWQWSNDVPAPQRFEFSWNNGKEQRVVSVGCNLLRITVLLESQHYVTFYDPVFAGVLVYGLKSMMAIFCD